MFLSNIKIKNKLMLVIIALLFSFLSITGIIIYQFVKISIHDEIKLKLQEQAALQKNNIESKIEDISQDMEFAGNLLKIKLFNGITLDANNYAYGENDGLVFVSSDGSKTYIGFNENNFIDYIIKNIGKNYVATIFKVIDNKAVRITTNIIKDGKRAVGTELAQNVYETVVIKKEKFFGMADILGGKYFTYYEPIFDEKAENVIAILFIGTDNKWLLEGVEKIVKNFKVGKSGYVFIINSKGDNLIHPELKGENSSDQKFIQEMMNKKEGYIKYKWNAHNKVNAYTYNAMNDWIIASSSNIEDFEDTINYVRNIIIGVLFISVILSIIISILFANSIAKPIIESSNHLLKMADGDFSFEISDKIINRKDEIGNFGQSFTKLKKSIMNKQNIVKEIAEGAGDFTVQVELASDKDIFGKYLQKMLESLNNVLGEVNNVIDIVTTNADQVSQASQSLSQGASEQASSLEEITSSIIEISSQAKQNTDNAIQANSLAKQSMENSNKGNVQMNELVNAMLEINKSADEIKRIVKVIDDIAFQTNLLALNANVEAARAGKYGKGFTVVAEEVRNLSTRSAVSVKETTSMVENAIKNIQNVNFFVESTAKQLKEITDSANKVSCLVDEITIASKEQTEGLDQINIGLGQIEQVTQANTANAEESASASEELLGQAHQLKDLIGKFSLKTHKLNNILPDNLSPQLLKLIKDELNKEKTK